MSAIGQPGGGGAPAAAPGASAPNAPAGGTLPAGSAQTTNPNDPWGFEGAVANAPEHLRQPMQAEFARVAQQLNERMGRYQPVEPFLDQLGPLLVPMNEQGQQDPNGSTVLEGLLSLYELFADQNRVEDLNDWWEGIGDEFGFFDDDDDGAGGGNGQPQRAAATPANNEPDLSALDPAAQAIVQQLMQQNQRLEARLGEFESNLTNTQQQQLVNQEADRIRTELQTLMQNHGIEGHDDLQSPASRDILRIAGGYGRDPEAISKAVADYARINGRPTPPNPAPGQQHGQGGVEALRAMLAGGGNAPAAQRTGQALGPGADAHEPELVKGFDQAKELAMQRFQQPGAIG